MNPTTPPRSLRVITRNNRNISSTLAKYRTILLAAMSVDFVGLSMKLAMAFVGHAISGLVAFANHCNDPTIERTLNGNSITSLSFDAIL